MKEHHFSLPLNMREKPAKCKHCGATIYFKKSAKGKWMVLEDTGKVFGSEFSCRFHKCNAVAEPKPIPRDIKNQAYATLVGIGIPKDAAYAMLARI